MHCTALSWHRVLLFGLILLALHSTPLLGQAPPNPTETGDAYFHRAAQHYLADDIDAARETVAAGLEEVPNHAKLRAFRERLDELPPDADPDAGAEAPDAPPTDSDADAETDASDDDFSPDEADPDAQEEGDGSPPPEDLQDSDSAPDPEGDAPAELPTPPPPTDDRHPSFDDEARTTEEAPSPHDGSEAPSSPESVPSLTQEQAEELLRLFEAQDQPLMHAFQQFGDPSDARESW